jgi:transcriptional regulator with XRE-family HTH domain
MDQIANKIKRLRKMRGFTQQQLADHLGVSQSSVSRWEKGQDEPSTEHIFRLASLAGEDVEDFAYRDEPSSHTMTSSYVIGQVQAGHWVTAVERPRQEWYPIHTLPAPEYGGVSRFCLEIVGHSCDRIFPDGSIVECVRFADLKDLPVSGDYVVAIRRCKDGLIEATAKQYLVDETGKPWLVPHSTRPEFQQPIDLTGPFPDEIESVEAWALIIGRYERIANPNRRRG